MKYRSVWCQLTVTLASLVVEVTLVSAFALASCSALACNFTHVSPKALAKWSSTENKQEIVIKSAPRVELHCVTGCQKKPKNYNRCICVNPRTALLLRTEMSILKAAKMRPFYQ